MGWLKPAAFAKRPRPTAFPGIARANQLQGRSVGRAPKPGLLKRLNLRLRLPYFTESSKTIRNPRLANNDGYIFRRSRTLTGTTSSRLAVNSAANAQLKTPRLKAHELKKVRSRVVKLLGILLICIAALVYIILNYVSGWSVTYSQQGKVNDSRASEYSQVLSQYFGGRPLERFSFFLNQSRLESYMLGQYPELASFTVTRRWYGGDVRFVAKLRTPILVWQTGQKRYYVDGEGSAFTYYQGSNAALVSVTDQSGIAPSEIDNTIASKRFINFLGKMVNAVNKGEKGQVSGVAIPPSTREIDLRLQRRGYLIKTNVDRDPLQQAEDIIAALKYFDTHKINPEYIDVRVSGKAFYK